VKETFKWVLTGTLIIFSITTILSVSGLGTSLGQDEDMLFFLQVISLLASIISTIGLIVTRTAKCKLGILTLLSASFRCSRLRLGQNRAAPQ